MFYCINRWLKNETIIKALIENRMISILYDSHIRNGEQLKKLYLVYFESENDFECFVYLLVSLIFSSLSIYFKEENKKSIETVFETVCKNAEIILDVFNIIAKADSFYYL